MTAELKKLIELERCPFCGDAGGHIIAVEANNIDGFAVVCNGPFCQVEGPRELTQFDAAIKWNTRSYTAQLDKMREALESCLTDMTDGDTVEPDGYLRSIKLAQAALRDMEG